jgi:protoporphyrinogen oxidase
VPRLTRQFIDGKFFDYPVNFAAGRQEPRASGRASASASTTCSRGCATGCFKKPDATFEDYVVANFGRTLAEFSMINYTEKIWGIPGAARSIRTGPSSASAGSTCGACSRTRSALGGKRGKGPKSLVDEFYYPQFGTGRIYEEIEKHLREDGHHRPLTSSEPIKVRHDGQRITAVDVRRRTAVAPCVPAGRRVGADHALPRTARPAAATGGAEARAS